ncbi:hypothetical protein CHA01nite_06600 [Chryseobacterium hagamense]|uniref:Acid shock protein n=2 Tax=Chryseobacterium hagamense TaxID=395935 RepID=A0A511YIA1_9FLAO|nr:hypothetical protein CHA01nite_06600 [Chryseobacterium hagamense]
MYNFESTKKTNVSIMKKFLTAMSVVLGLGLATAQHTTAAVKTQTVKTVKPVKQNMPATTAKPAASMKPAAAPAVAKMKKDGTPDKRYKVNKNLKKDGTPDKRYKANK